MACGPWSKKRSGQKDKLKKNENSFLHDFFSLLVHNDSKKIVLIIDIGQQIITRAPSIHQLCFRDDGIRLQRSLKVKDGTNQSSLSRRVFGSTRGDQKVLACSSMDWTNRK
jgi:hypothetical protein